MANFQGGMQSDDRSVFVSGNVEGSSIVTGDGNRVSVSHQSGQVPRPEEVDILGELNALKKILIEGNSLQGLDEADRFGVTSNIELAERQAGKAKPDKEKVKDALEKALDYLRIGDQLTKLASSIAPHLINIAGWLQEGGIHLLEKSGLTPH